VALADTAVIFPIGGIPRQVQFVFDAPVPPVERKETMRIGFFRCKARYSTDDLGGGFFSFGADAAYFENLSCEREVDSTGRDRRSDNAPGMDPSVGFFKGAMG
jgi:hypothetical protein